MSKKMKISLATLGAAVIGMYVYLEGHAQALMLRFPDVDPKIVRKLSNEMFWEALMGKYSDVELTDEFLDGVFQDKLQHLTH